MKVLSAHVIRDHVLLGALAALILAPFLGLWGSLVFWLSTILVDLDHYLNFSRAARFTSFGLGSMFRYHEALFERRARFEFLNLEIFHTVEFVILLAGLVLTVLPSAGPVLAGVLFHILIDLIHLKKYGVLSKRAHSVVEYFWRRKKIFSRGKNPSSLFTEALQSINLIPQK